MSQSSESPQPSDDISLDELAAAFAEVMGRGAAASPDRPAEAPTEEGEEQPSEEDLEAEASAMDDDAVEVSPLTILEAMLFVGNPASEPLAAQRAAELMRGVEPSEIPDLVERLNERYAKSGCPYHIVSEGPGYRMTLRPEFAAVRAKFYGKVREARLSQAAVDVLAIVAYRQPVTAEDVSTARGSPSGSLLTQLVRRRLLWVERPLESPRTPRYRTTDRFLQLFGLENLDDLPQSEDLDSR